MHSSFNTKMTTKKKKEKKKRERERVRDHKGGGDKIFSCPGYLVFFCVFLLLLLLTFRSDSDDYQVIASAIFVTYSVCINYCALYSLWDLLNNLAFPLVNQEEKEHGWSISLCAHIDGLVLADLIFTAIVLPKAVVSKEGAGLTSHWRWSVFSSYCTPTAPVAEAKGGRGGHVGSYF